MYDNMDLTLFFMKNILKVLVSQKLKKNIFEIFNNKTFCIHIRFRVHSFESSLFNLNSLF